MRIKELEDVLKLVDEMPPEHQMKCAKSLMWYVEDWEGFQAEGVSWRQWVKIRNDRSKANSDRALKRALDALAEVQRKMRE